MVLVVACTGVDAETTASGAPATNATTSEPPTTEPPITEPATTEPATTEPPTTEPPQPRVPVVLGFAGDTTFTNGLDGRDPLSQIADQLSSYDLMTVNLETAVADPDVGRPPVAKRFLFKSPPSSLDLLVDAGVDAVTLGNNHALDFGHDAVVQTVDELDARGLLRVGAGTTEDEAYTPLVAEVGDWTVAIHSFSRVPCDWSASGENVRPEVAWACPPFLDRADQEILALLDEVDVTIVNVHGGEEGVLCPSGFMRELHEHWAALGVDVVVGGHPHVVQGVGGIDGPAGTTLVAYSTGNFAFPPASGITANSIVVELTVSEPEFEADPVIEMSIWPVRADGGVMRPASEAQAEAILDQINRHSTGWRLDAAGRMESAPDQIGAC